jgi:O-antigen ligase
MHFMRWCFIVCFLSGLVLSTCAFIPATGPYLVSMGAYYAGNMGDGILRLVELPGYGLFLVEVSVCPALFRLKFWQSSIVFTLGMFMIILGGNRSALAGAFIAVPVMLLLRRRVGAVILSLGIVCVFILSLRVTVSTESRGEISPLLRSFGVFDSKIDKASGGDASAEWRYEMWADAWKKIMEYPLTGKGYGHLPQHVDADSAVKSTDFETALAGGEAHNGFVSSAYGFGIPFMIALSIAILLYFLKEASLALRADKHDPEMIDLHAFLAGMFATYPILIYTAFDLSVFTLWLYAAISTILTHLPRKEYEQITSAGTALRKYGDEPRPAGQYSYRPR